MNLFCRSFALTMTGASLCVLLLACGNENSLPQNGLNNPRESQQPVTPAPATKGEISISVPGYSSPLTGSLQRSGEFTIHSLPSLGTVGIRSVGTASPSSEDLLSERFCRSTRSDALSYSWRREAWIFRKIRNTETVILEASLAPFFDESWLKHQIALAQPKEFGIKEPSIKITNPIVIRKVSSNLVHRPSSITPLLGSSQSVNPLPAADLSGAPTQAWALYQTETRAMDTLCDLAWQNSGVAVDVSGTVGKQPFGTHVEFTGMDQANGNE
ncbi:hypothetical protein EB061_02070 [bacterium]|jgi:hypothetical protein|nr:hypothetical protein [bacterium]